MLKPGLDRSGRPVLLPDTKNLQPKAMSGSSALLEPESLLMSESPVPIKDHADSQDLGFIAMSGSMVLQQLGSVLMCVACVTSGGHKNHV